LRSGRVPLFSPPPSERMEKAVDADSVPPPPSSRGVPTFEGGLFPFFFFFFPPFFPGKWKPRSPPFFPHPTSPRLSSPFPPSPSKARSGAVASGFFFPPSPPSRPVGLSGGGTCFFFPFLRDRAANGSVPLFSVSPTASFLKKRCVVPSLFPPVEHSWLFFFFWGVARFFFSAPFSHFKNTPPPPFFSPPSPLGPKRKVLLLSFPS